MTLRKLANHKYALTAIGLTVATVTQMVIGAPAHAAFSTVTVRFDRMQASTPSTGMICAQPATSGTVAKVLFTLPTGYSASSTLANWTVDTTNKGWPSGATAWPGISTASAVSGQVVTFPSNTLTTGTTYCFNWNNSNAVTTASAGTSYQGALETQTSGSATIDRSNYTTSTVSNDQIVVTATVPQSFSFALSRNTDDFTGTPLSTASVSTSPTAPVATVNTNAKNGWTVWAQDTNVGLKSPSAGNYTIASRTPGTNSTLSAGSEGYNTGVSSSQSSGSGTISIATPFIGGSTGKGGGLDTSFRPIASSNGTASNAALTMTNNITISAITPAATDYTDTITVVGAGLF